MGKTGAFWRGLTIGVILGIFLLQFVVGFWIWEHHMFVFGLTNKAAFIGGLGVVGVLILLGVVIGRVSKQTDKG
jgi:hypothetical protein